MNIKAPFKLAIAQIFMDDKARTAEEIYGIMEPEYSTEKKMCNLEHIETCLHSLKTVGILKANETSLPVQYELTSHGKNKVLKG